MGKNLEERGGNLLLRVMLEAMDGSNTWKRNFYCFTSLCCAKNPLTSYIMCFSDWFSKIWKRKSGKDSLVFIIKYSSWVNFAEIS